MNPRILLIALLALIGVALFTGASRGLASLTQDIPKESKEQPKKINLHLPEYFLQKHNQILALHDHVV